MGFLRTRTFFGILLSVGIAIPALYNACTPQTNFTKLNGSISVGNPMTPVSNELLTAVCNVINRCNPQVSVAQCQTGVIGVPGIGEPLGLPTSFSTLGNVIQGEQSGSLVGNLNPAGVCYNSITSLSCSAPQVKTAYIASSSNPFSGAVNMVSGTSCGSSFTPVVQYSCSSKVFLLGANNITNGPTVSGQGITYSISPALPIGLNINPSTGIISGTPTVVTPMTAYTVSAVGPFGTTNSPVQIETGNGFIVNDLGDAADVSPGDGICQTASGTCTLRAAVQEANSDPTSKIILLPQGTIAVGSSISISTGMEIDGNCSQGTTIDGGGSTQILGISAGPTILSSMTIQNGGPSSAAVIIGNSGVPTYQASLNNMTFQNNINTASGAFGGAIQVFGNSSNQQTILNVNGSIFSGNQVTGSGSVGGAIEFFNNFTEATITNSSFIKNFSQGSGGAIFYGGNALTVNQSIFYSNSSNGTAGAIDINASATGVQNFTNDTVVSNSGLGAGFIYQANANITNCTFVNNSATGGGGVFDSSTGTLANNLFENNTSAGVLKICAVPMTSSGGNLSDDAASDCGLGVKDFVNTLASLGPLQNNGGPTETESLLPGSPGIGQGSASSCPATDQRGATRTVSACDIGAFQSQ